MTKNPRTLIQLTASIGIALVMAIAFAVVGGLSPTRAQGGPGSTSSSASGNHGSIVSSVARSTCTATNPHNPSVSNHGMCVSSVARSQHTSTTTTTTSTSAAAGAVTRNTSKSTSTHGGKHGKKNTKTHHTTKTHKNKKK